MHLNMLGADGPGKAEATVGAVASCALFCDEWEQASHGGELTGAVEAGMVTRDQVTDLGAVLTGEAPGRPGPEAVTLFDSTGLAIQDLAIAAAALEAWRAGARRGAGGAPLAQTGSEGDVAPDAPRPPTAAHRQQRSRCPLSTRCVAVVSAAFCLAFSPCSMACWSIVSAQANSSERIARPTGMTTNAGPGVTSMIRPPMRMVNPATT